MLEFYQAYANYHDLMTLTEELVAFVAQEVNGTTITEFNGVEIDLGNWKRYTMRAAIIELWPTEIPSKPTLERLLTVEALQSLLRETSGALEMETYSRDTISDSHDEVFQRAGGYRPSSAH